MAATNGGASSTENGGLGVAPPAHVVIPPKGIRENIHKTADFIKRRGASMEESIRKRAATDGKANMSFINPDDAYNAYFAWYLQQLREGKHVTADAGKSAPGEHDNKPKGPVEPARFRFSARMPNISAKDLEILKVTALYAARNGENWLKDLRNREIANYQYDFLRPNHSFYHFFRSIIDQYKILLREESTVEARIQGLQLNIKNRFHVLDRAKQRAEYVKYVSQQKEKEEKKEADEKREYASIDWHDFAVIATVTFDEGDDAADLPAPTSMNDLMSASLEQKAEISISRRLEEAMPDESTYYNVSHRGGYPGYQPPATPIAPPVQPAYQPPPAVPYHTPALRTREEEEQRAREQAERDRAQAQAAAMGAPSTMRIREDYVPRAVGKKSSAATVICPNCKQQIPADEMEEHIRIELLDPRWKEQREKADARYSSTVNSVDVANNLKRFASQRDDIYDGVTGIPISEEERARRKKAALSYDGQPDPAKDAARLHQMQSLNVQDQLRQMREKYGGK